MSTPLHRDRILRTLGVVGQPLDDDQLSAQTAVRPRQTVSQICQALEREGLLRRYVGRDGKIVNELLAPASPSGAGSSGTAASAEREQPVSPAAEGDLSPSSSHVQRAAEGRMLDELSKILGLPLKRTTIPVASGQRIEVDGADLEQSVLVECWAHQGTTKSAQRHKVLADAFKLTWIAQTKYPRPRLVLCLSDLTAAMPFLPSSRSWAARALQDLAIEIYVVELPPDVRQAIRDAQGNQDRRAQ